MAKYNVQEFAELIKTEYPDYAEMDDLELTKMVVSEYPEYEAEVDIEGDDKKKKKKKDEWQPNPNIDYEALPLMDKERANYETWKQKQIKSESDKVTSITPDKVNIIEQGELDQKVKENQLKLKQEAEQQISSINTELPPENDLEFVENTNQVRDNLIKNNPEIAAEKERIAKDLQVEFNKSLEAIKVKHGIDPKAISLELSKKYDFSDAKQVVEAEKEFTRIYNEKINSAAVQADVKSLQEEFRKYGENAYNNLSESPLFKSIFKESQKAVNEVSDPLFTQFKRDNASGVTGVAFDVADYLKGLGKGTVFEDIPIIGSVPSLVGTAVESAQLGNLQVEKGFRAAKVSMEQLGIQNIEKEIQESQATAMPIRDDQVIKVFANGTIDYEGSGIKRPMSATAGQSALDVYTSGKNVPRYNAKGELITGPISIGGGKMQTTEMTYGEWVKQKRNQQEYFKTQIEGNIEEILNAEELMSLVDQADFFDEDGATIKDVVSTVFQMAPQLAASTAGGTLAGVTGGASLVASTMFMWGMEYGNNYWDALATGLSEELGRPPTNEEIVDALLNDEYQGQGEAAGWAAVSSLLEQATGIKASKQLNETLKEFAKKSGYKNLKDMMVKTGKNQFKDMLKDGGKELASIGKNGLTEFLTEGLQSLTNQASISQTLGGNAICWYSFTRN